MLQLPSDIIKKISLYLRDIDNLKFCMTTKRIYSIIYNDDNYWKLRFSIYIGTPKDPEESRSQFHEHFKNPICIHYNRGKYISYYCVTARVFNTNKQRCYSNYDLLKLTCSFGFDQVLKRMLYKHIDYLPGPLYNIIEMVERATKKGEINCIKVILEYIDHYYMTKNQPKMLFQTSCKLMRISLKTGIGLGNVELARYILEYPIDNKTFKDNHNLWIKKGSIKFLYNLASTGRLAMLNYLFPILKNYIKQQDIYEMLIRADKSTCNNKEALIKFLKTH